MTGPVFMRRDQVPEGHEWQSVDGGSWYPDDCHWSLDGEWVRVRPVAAIPPDRWPDPHDFIVQLREAVGLFAGALPIPPKVAWDEAVAVAKRAVQERDEYEAALLDVPDDDTAAPVSARKRIDFPIADTTSEDQP